jgi:hypothetical protein
MTRVSRAGYTRRVSMTPSKTASRAAGWAWAILPILALALAPRAARADVTAFDNANAPIVRVVMRRGDIAIRTWDRPTVEVDGDPSLIVTRRTTQEPVDRSPIFIPQDGPLDGRPMLPAESFVVSTIAPGPHDTILVRNPTDAPVGTVTVTIPADTPFVFAFAREGNVDVDGYRGGTFVGFTGPGHLALRDVAGTVFAQTNRGPITIEDATLDRVRARSLYGNVAFERCRVRQIETTDVAGSIVFDGGSFDPGLARFDSTRGNVAIGTQGPAQLGARVAGAGRVYTNFSREARIASGDGQTNAVVGGGGPVVIATSQFGNVYLYDGSLRTRQQLPDEWRAALETLRRPSLRLQAPARTGPLPRVDAAPKTHVRPQPAITGRPPRAPRVPHAPRRGRWS